MRQILRKISAIATSALLAGMTMGIAAASTYPAPFVSGSTADVAIVYGSTATMDVTPAGSVETDLSSRMPATADATVSGGDSVKLEKSSTKFQLGMGVTDVISTSVTDDSPGTGLPTLLADGEYTDNDNDGFDFTQKIDLANFSLTMFDDDDYKSDTPTVGSKINSAGHVLNYTLTFTDTPLWEDLTNSNMYIMGKKYFVLSVNSTTTAVLNLLDAANTATVSEGETKDVDVAGKKYEVSIAYVGSAEVKLKVNSETTNSLAEAQTQKLTDGSYIGIKDIMYDSKTGSVSSVEFSIGTGKLVIKDQQDVQLNDDYINDLTGYITLTGAGYLSKIVLEWDAKDETFLAPDKTATMPGFGAIKLSFAGMTYPAEETVEVKGGSTTYLTLDNFPLKDGPADINFLYGDSYRYQAAGKDSTHLLRVSNETNFIFNASTDDYFVASYDDGSNVESYLMRASNFNLDNYVNRTNFEYLKDGTWTIFKENAQNGDQLSIGNVGFTVSVIQKTDKSVNITAGFAGDSNTHVNFHTLFTKEGMKVYLPYANKTSTAGTTSDNRGEFNSSNSSRVFLILSEEDKNENVGQGKNITLVLGWNSASTPEAYVADVGNESVTFAEVGSDSKIWESHLYSALATKIIWDKSGDAYSAKVIYHGEESYGAFYITAPTATIGGGSLGTVKFTDADKTAWSGKNVIVIGGSCVNNAAAQALGVPEKTCTADFTAKTGVGTGQFLIQSVGSAFASGKIALVVAGYEAADTVAAVTYLTKNAVDTTAGKKYKGTTASNTALVVE